MAWAIVDAVFPPRCGGCARAGQRFCSTCQATLHYLSSPVCERCGYPIRTGGQCPVDHSPTAQTLSGVRSAAFFEGPLRHAVHRLKYHRDIILADSLGQVLREAWQAFQLPGEVVIPVPLSAERLRERGYNQAALLARAFAELAGLPYAPTGIARIRHSASQVGLSAHERQANVSGAFEGRANVVRGRSVILVDDVCTTGATLAACAEALRAAGAGQVWGLTLARPRFE
ncbi:MAG: ComF family protein [Anaerolineales bacterium]